MQGPIILRFWGTARGAGLLAAALLTLSACGRDGDAEQPPAPGDQAVAEVDGKTIWTSDVKREAIAQGLIGEGEPLDASSELFRRVLDEVVDQKLLAAEAIKLKLDKDPAAQRRLAAARERILGDMLIEGVVADAVKEDAIKGLYEEQLKLAKQSEEFRARQVVVSSLPEADAVKKLLASGASFEALAMERSTDPATRFNGGDLGYFTTDVMPEPYDAALKTAKVGDVVGPFQVEGGWALLKVEDRRLEQPISLESARPQIVRFLTYDQIRDVIEKLRGRAEVEILLARAPNAADLAKEPASAPAKAAPPGAASTPAATPPSKPAAAPPLAKAMTATAAPVEKKAPAPRPRSAPKPAARPEPEPTLPSAPQPYTPPPAAPSPPATP